MWQKVSKFEVQIFENKSLFADGGIRSLPFVMFINNKTGETKLFLKSFVEEQGTDTVLKRLNKGNG